MRVGKNKTKKRIFLAVLLIIVIILIYPYYYNNRGNNEKEAIEKAVISSAVQCCSIEGNYPSDIEYLKENYGLQIDEEKYIIVYQVVGSNVMPEVTVLEKGK